MRNKKKIVLPMFIIVCLIIIPITGWLRVESKQTLDVKGNIENLDVLNMVGEFSNDSTKSNLEKVDLLNKISDNITSTEQTATVSQEPLNDSEFANKIVVNVESYLNIRKQPDENSEVVGKLFHSSGADIVQSGNEWTEIKSGSVKGWVNNKYIVTGVEAEKLVESLAVKTAVIKTDHLRIREKADTTSTILANVSKGESYIVEEELDDWVKVIYTSSISGYLSKDYVKVKEKLGEAVSIKEENELLDAVETTENQSNKEEKKQEDSSDSNKKNSTDSRSDHSYGDEYLLAGLIQMEAGSSYDGMLAVANVVINRLHSGYGSSLKAVIYAPGQFPGANNGLLEKYLSSGPSRTARSAARAALSGKNNIGGCKSFNSVRSVGKRGKVIGGNSFY